ncbi:catalase [Fusarium mexicanum]|uniref:Catalase n=1 Tax=Fusarium mexicanum TaxID=751941 RepID=A0A8H5MJM3_9HYPO|nr:catalase [Fusarium mexicanum]
MAQRWEVTDLQQIQDLERMVHSCGSGAFGYFECTQDPVFFCRDPIQGPDVIRSQSCNPTNFLLANTPEANHAGLMFFSDHGTPQGWRFNHGYGCHTFNQRQFTDSEAMQMCGEDSGYSQRHLWEAIEKGEEIEWAAHVQAMDPRQAHPDKLRFDPFDVTKVWPRSQFPMKEFGWLVLNKNPENFHHDVEQAAFSPGSIVPGIEDSPDPLLQSCIFFYRNAQYRHTGVNLQVLGAGL